MVVYKKLKIKGCPTFIFHNVVNIKKIDLDAIGVKEISSSDYEVEYYENLIYDSPLYLIFNDVDAYFLSTNEEKYSIFASTDKNKDILENYKELWSTIRRKISRVNDIKKVKMFDFKDLVKVTFKCDNIPLGKIINIPMCVIIIKFLFKINGVFYPNIYLHNCYLECNSIEFK